MLGNQLMRKIICLFFSKNSNIFRQCVSGCQSLRHKQFRHSAISTQKRVFVQKWRSHFDTGLDVSTHFLKMSFLCFHPGWHSVDFVLVDFKISQTHLICINLHKLTHLKPLILKMLYLFKQVNYRGVSGVYTHVFHPWKSFHYILKTTEQPNLHKLT